MIQTKSKILFYRDQIQKRIKELGKEITEDYKDKSIFMAVILKGAFVFASDLIRNIKKDVYIDFMQVTSYQGTKTTGDVKISKDLDEQISGRHVIIIEDIIDTGITVKKIIELLKMRNPKTIEVCSFLNKPSQRIVDINIKYIGFSIENFFVVGYGMDYNQNFRQYPDIRIL